VNVVTDGWYTFSSNGITDPAGYIYKDNFNPFYPRENLLSEDTSISYSNFQLITHLQANTTYVLVVTTYRSREIGAFLIFVLGPNNVSLNRISEYLYYFVNNQHRIQNTENVCKLNFTLNPQKGLENPVLNTEQH